MSKTHCVLMVVGAFFWAAMRGFAGDWAAYSVVDRSSDQKSLLETIYLVNETAKAITLSFPNFQFAGRANKPAESLGPMGDVTVGPGEAIRFLHSFPLDEKDGFNNSIGIQDIQENILVKQLETDIPEKRPKVKMTLGAVKAH